MNETCKVEGCENETSGNMRICPECYKKAYKEDLHLQQNRTLISSGLLVKSNDWQSRLG